MEAAVQDRAGWGQVHGVWTMFHRGRSDINQAQINNYIT